MTELEAATIASQQATIANQQASLAAAHIQAGAAGAVGILQAVVVGWGIRHMVTMGDRREQQQADRHAETMEVLCRGPLCGR